MLPFLENWKKMWKDAAQIRATQGIRLAKKEAIKSENISGIL